MKRRLNFTGRERLKNSNVTIKIDEHTKSFSANINLSNLNLPDKAQIFVEAYHQTFFKRYSWGTVKEQKAPDYTGLQDYGNIEDLKFRIIVVNKDVDNETGLILASTEGIRPEGIYKKESILPVKYDDIGRRVWTLDFDEEPVLIVNKKIENIEQMILNDAGFRLCIFPAAMREILLYIFLVDKIDDLEDPEIDWHKKWLDFAKAIAPAISLPSKGDNGYEPDEVYDWVNKIEQEFCYSRLNKDWKKLLELEEI